jgi:hypothetical protein
MVKTRKEVYTTPKQPSKREAHNQFSATAATPSSVVSEVPKLREVHPYTLESNLQGTSKLMRDLILFDKGKPIAPRDKPNAPNRPEYEDMAIFVGRYKTLVAKRSGKFGSPRNTH